MKTMKLLFTLLMVACFATVGFGQITGSAHDLSGRAWNASGEICIVCHTPHNAITSVADAPLWNHEVTATTFLPDVYASNTLDATIGEPDGSSKLCLSCHDGTVALENFGGASGGTNYISAGNNVGIDISDDHPISFDYNAALATADGGLENPVVALSDLTATGTIDDDMLIAGKLQCSSCHDVHRTSGVTNLLLKSNAASDLCLTCHIK